MVSETIHVLSGDPEPGVSWRRVWKMTLQPPAQYCVSSFTYVLSPVSVVDQEGGNPERDRYGVGPSVRESQRYWRLGFWEKGSG